MKKEYKIGETFQCGLVKLKCKKAINGCVGCFLCDIITFQDDCKILVGECDKRMREDKQDVIFVKVEDKQS